MPTLEPRASSKSAIVGSGPVDSIQLKPLPSRLLIKVDMFDKLPVPYGLVRYGVAPTILRSKMSLKFLKKLLISPNFHFLVMFM